MVGEHCTEKKHILEECGNIFGIAHTRTNRKDNIFMQRRLLVQSFTHILDVGVREKDLYIDEAHTALAIFRFAAFLTCDKNCCAYYFKFGSKNQFCKYVKKYPKIR